MPNGIVTSGVLQDSLNTVIASARVIREYGPVMSRFVDKVTLAPGTGLNWKEILLNRLQAHGIDELYDLEQSPQQITDSGFSINLTAVGMSVFITDRAKRVISPIVAAKIGSLTENAMSRKKDLDLIAVAQTFTTDLGTAGSPMESGFVSAAVARIRTNATEPWDGPTVTVLHPFQLKDIQDEIVAGVGTYTIPVGLTEDVFLRGFTGKTLYDSAVWTDPNITVNSSDDAEGFTFASGSGGAIVLVQGEGSRHITERKENIGTGAEIMYATDEYGIGLRQAAWGFTYTTDATAPVQ